MQTNQGCHTLISLPSSPRATYRIKAAPPPTCSPCHAHSSPWKPRERPLPTFPGLLPDTGASPWGPAGPASCF